MNTKKLLLFIFSILLIFSLPLLCAANVPLMSVEDIRPGMQGIGKTVINGDNIENFNVEVIGVTGSEAGGYSILVRTSGDVIEKSGGVAQGIIWGIMALGVYITFRLLDVADLTVDGSFTTGGAVTVMLIIAGWPAWAALLAAVVADYVLPWAHITAAVSPKFLARERERAAAGMLYTAYICYVIIK